MQSFAGVMSNISGQQQTVQNMPQQQDAMQMPGMQMPGIGGMQSNFPPMMPGGNMPSEMPEMPDGETPPAMPDGETPPAMPDGETPPAMPTGQELPEIPSGEMPVSAPSESDSNMPQPPFGQSGFGGMSGMQRPGSFSNPFGSGSMSFMNR